MFIGGLLEQDAKLAAGLVVFLCYKLCAPHVKVPTCPVQPLEKREDYGRILWTNAYLCLMSGIVNAVAFLEMGMTVSHHTGNTTHTGRLWVDGGGARFLGLILAFMVGSGIVGANDIDQEAVFKGRYSPPLMSSALAVAAGMVLAHAGGSTTIALQLLSFSQGILNAVTRKFPGMPVCGSHVTGYATDAGSILGTWARAQWAGDDPVNLKKPTIFLVSMGTFALGGFLTAHFKEQFGVTFLAVPAAGTAMAAMAMI